jgi:transcriptional regulator with XRE-family HTH domain
MLGMSAATLSRVESGGHLPHRDHLLVLADWVGLQLDRQTRARRNAAVHGDNAGTMEAIELHLRADKELRPEDAEILVDLVKTAYKRMNNRK